MLYYAACHNYVAKSPFQAELARKLGYKFEHVEGDEEGDDHIYKDPMDLLGQEGPGSEQPVKRAAVEQSRTAEQHPMPEQSPVPDRHLVAEQSSPAIDLSKDLRVSKQASNLGFALIVQFVGRGALTIKSYSVNNRPECTHAPKGQESIIEVMTKNFPITLKTGDKAVFAAYCDIIRATLVTDQGSSEVTWNN